MCVLNDVYISGQPRPTATKPIELEFKRLRLHQDEIHIGEARKLWGGGGVKPQYLCGGHDVLAEGSNFYFFDRGHC